VTPLNYDIVKFDDIRKSFRLRFPPRGHEIQQERQFFAKEEQKAAFFGPV